MSSKVKEHREPLVHIAKRTSVPPVKAWIIRILSVAASLIILGSCFHVSGLVLLPMVFLNNKELTGKSKLIWSSVVPAGYVLYFVGVGVLMMLDIPMVGAKLASYQQAEDTGQYGTGVNVFGPLYLLNVLVYFYLMYFSKTLTGHNKYFALLMKIFAIGIASYAALSFVTVIAIRVSLLIWGTRMFISSIE